MKTNLITTILLLIATAAWAGNEGPQATTRPQKTLIAQMAVSSGFVPPWVPAQTTIDIESNGNVTATKTFQDGKIQVQALAFLAPEVLKSLEAQIQLTQAGELYDPNPEQPRCTDAPSTTYYAIHADGLKISVGGKSGCKELMKRNATSGDYAVQNVLDGLATLAAIP